MATGPAPCRLEEGRPGGLRLADAGPRPAPDGRRHHGGGRPHRPPPPPVAAAPRPEAGAELAAVRAALDESEERLRHFADTLSEVLWIVELDADGERPVLSYASPAFECVWGRPGPLPPGAADTPLRWPVGVHPEDRGRVEAAIGAALRAGHPYEATYRVVRPDGTLRWLRDRGGPARRGAGGGRARFAGVAEDVTAEEALRAVNETLEARIEQRTAQLAEEALRRAVAQDALRHAQKLEALGQLAGGVAHDFNNAMAVVLAGLALLEKRHGPALAAIDPGVPRLLRGVLEGAERGAAVARRLLTFARREELRATLIDPAEALGGMREVLATAIGHRVSVRVEAPPGLPPVCADRVQLEAALINLAVNARDAMPEGGVVTLGAVADEWPPSGGAPGSPPPAGLAPGRYVRLWVTDTGCGMDVGTRARATEPFFTTKPKDRGTGLGLSMVDGFAAQSGGAIAIDSAPGRGTTVSLWLPQATRDEEVVEGRRGAAMPAAVAGPRRALVVDDKPMMRRFLAECLRHEGWETEEVDDAGQALARLGRVGIDLLITDLAMPGMDGGALIRAARARFPGLPALLVTGSGSAAEIARLAESEGFAVLRKPVSPAELADAVATLCPAPAAAAGDGNAAR